MKNSSVPLQKVFQHIEIFQYKYRHISSILYKGNNNKELPKCVFHTHILLILTMKKGPAKQLKSVQ